MKTRSMTLQKAVPEAGIRTGASLFHIEENRT